MSPKNPVLSRKEKRFVWRTSLICKYTVKGEAEADLRMEREENGIL